MTNLGGPTLPSVDAILTAPTGLDLEQDAAAAILATLGTAGTIDLSGQTSGFTTVFAATARTIDDVRYALSQLTYKAPADDATCHLDIAFSDLGNNGTPIRLIAPDLQADPAVPEHEIPDALADSASVTFVVKDTRPEVTISQVAPSTAGRSGRPEQAVGLQDHVRRCGRPGQLRGERPWPQCEFRPRPGTRRADPHHSRARLHGPGHGHR